MTPGGGNVAPALNAGGSPAGLSAPLGGASGGGGLGPPALLGPPVPAPGASGTDIGPPAFKGPPVPAPTGGAGAPPGLSNFNSIGSPSTPGGPQGIVDAAFGPQPAHSVGLYPGVNDGGLMTPAPPLAPVDAQGGVMGGLLNPQTGLRNLGGLQPLS